ncbi:MAG TPA: TauD/TfdA family dioxygenase [Acidimicrobiia bacterium]|nr:TauD/TfdA family dioxygenase [Acidimicrobiia bacterium]
MTTITVAQGLDVRPLTNVIGAEVTGIDLRQPLDEAAVAQISDALVRWKVLFFRDQHITQDQQVAFGRAFGDLTPAHPIGASVDEKPELLAIDAREHQQVFRYAVDRAPFAEPRRTLTGWHTDVTFVANPPTASILRGVVIPLYGGDTMWTNLVAAYQDLSAPIRGLLDGLQAVHRWHGYEGRTRPGHDAGAPPPAAVHPVVRVHPVSGEKALFVNPVFTRYIVGLSDRESAALLELLFGQISRPQFTVRFRWEPDSIAFWDNRATAHVGPVDVTDGDYDRRVERVTVVGDLTVGPDGFQSQTIDGELFGAQVPS